MKKENMKTDVFENPYRYIESAEQDYIDKYEKGTKTLDLDPESFGGEDFPALLSPEDEELIKSLYEANPHLKQIDISDSWIQTYSGHKFYPLNPQLESICIEDIAHALSLQCRFTGHCKFHYSVAQHSVLVSYLCNDEDKLHGLLHDASEAYIADVSSPIKRLPQLSGYKLIEEKIQKTIYNKFGLTKMEPPSVKQADLLMLGIEAQSLLNSIHPDWKFPIKPPPFGIMSLTPIEAEDLFLERFRELYNK